MPQLRTSYNVCSLCEAGCGLAFDIDAEQAVGVRGDDEDVLSQGYVCPKGVAMLDLEHDKDRLKTPMRRDANGVFHPISWEEAYQTIALRIKEIQHRHGRDAVATYFGTPVVHKHSALLMRSALLNTLKTRNSTSAGSQDTSPRFAASYFLYGSTLSIPIPDLERTDYLLCVGANPLVSNGSLLTAPNMRSRLRAIRERGGKVVVVDPRQTETARAASEHVSIKPGGDAAFLFAMAQVILSCGRVDEKTLEQHTQGWKRISALLNAFTPESVEKHTGIDATTIRRLAHEFSEARTSVAYARLGVCNNAYSTLASYAIDLLNLITGRLGVPGGAMFTTPAVDLTGLSRMTGSDGFARWHSRVRGLPETSGDLPASILAEEIETQGEGQIRALITFAGNPVLSTPNSKRLAAAFAQLEFMVCIDMYINETTRFADIILPPAGALAEEHVDVFFGNVAVRNIIRWTTPAIPRAEDERCDWEILLELSYRLGGGPAGVKPLDWLLRQVRKMGLHFTPALAMDLALRFGPYGDRFLPWHHGLNGKKVRESLHGIDLGPLQPGFKKRIFHRHQRIDLAPATLMSHIEDLRRELDKPETSDELLLIGRRDIRSNNSWMHNVGKLMGGRPRCLLFIHPQDAHRLGIIDGGQAVMQNHIHCGTVTVKVTDEIRPGVVSLPHGWGHEASAPWQSVAGANAGVSANDWTDDQAVESVVGQSILNGVPVQLRALIATETVAVTSKYRAVV